MLPRTAIRLTATVIASALAHTALAQQPVDLRRDARPAGVRPLDEGVEDVGPLSESLRVVETGLAPHASFDQVFEVPGFPDLLMRVEGGLYAVFPRSLYTRQGVAIPHDTTFYIGRPLFLDVPAQASPAFDGQRAGVDPNDQPIMRLITRPVWRTQSAVLPTSRDDAFIADARYREARLRELLLTAAGAAVSGEQTERASEGAARD